MNDDVIDIGSFMQVLNNTYEIDDGIEFPGHAMPSGRPVQSKGVTKATLMSSRELAQQWFEAVKGQYEREESEADQEGSYGDLSGPAVQGPDTNTGVARADESPKAQAYATVEEELAAREAEWNARVDARRAALERQKELYDESVRELRAVRRALKAVRGKG